MSLEISIRENCAGLRSDRVTERKKNAEAVKGYLNNDAAPALLSANSFKRSGYNWNNLFDDVHEFVLKECEKFETAKSFDNMKPLCANLLLSTVAGANKDKIYIKCDKITEACVYFLKSNRLLSAFGDTFLNLLYKHIFQYEYYLGSISPETWKELLEICISIYKSGRSIIDDYTKLRLIFIIIQSAVNYCQFTSTVVDFLPQIQSFYTLSITDKKVQETLVEIAALLSEQLATEYRLTDCEFTETIIPIITRFYDQNVDKKRKEPLFKFLKITMMLHHPQGKLHTEVGSLAHSWSLWRTELSSILEIMHLEVYYLQKSAYSKFKSHIENPDLKICESFLQLAARICYQVINFNDECSEYPEQGPSPKRPRLTFNRYKTFNDLIEALQQNPFPWIKIVYVYLTHFGSSVSSNNYMQLLGVLESYITNNISHFNWEDYKKIMVLVLQNTQNSTDLLDNPILTSIWKTSVRYSTSTNSAHDSLHAIIKTIIGFGILNNEQIIPLIKLYNENAMPVTDCSISTLNMLSSQYFGNFTDFNDRSACFSWLKSGDYSLLNDNLVNEFFLRCIAKDKIVTSPKSEHTTESDPIYNILFRDTDKSLLFAEFELELDTIKMNKEMNKTCNNLEPDIKLKNAIEESINKTIDNSIEKLLNKEIKLIDFNNLIRIALAYCDNILKFGIISQDELSESIVFTKVKDALSHLFIFLPEILKNDAKLNVKVKLLQNVQYILINDYDMFLNEAIRTSINSAFFHKMESIINCEPRVDEDIEVQDDVGNNITDVIECHLKFNCIYLLAAYCSKNSVHRTEVLELILNPALYNFTRVIDVKTAVRCMQLLNSSIFVDIPVELMFALLRSMCKVLFRCIDASIQILEILCIMLDNIFSRSISTMADNCVIMIKGYLSRCQKLYYPPRLAAVLYKCVARIITYKEKLSEGNYNYFNDALFATMSSNVNSLRLYCCHLLSKTMAMDSNLKSTLMDIFKINIAERSEISLKDELVNRTATVLHWFLALMTSKQDLTLDIVNYIMQLHNIKKLDDKIVKKVLIKIVYTTTKKNLQEYLSKNLLEILKYWFTNKYKVRELPISFFGCGNLDNFVEKHMSMLVPAEVLWSKNGKFSDSETVPMIRHTTTYILEKCFSYTITLCLPYVACDKYNVQLNDASNHNITRNAKALFQYFVQTLDSNRMSSLVMENLGLFVLYTSSNLYDERDLKDKFHIKISYTNHSCFNLEVFGCILSYIGEMIDSNVMQYLSEKQPLGMSKIIIKLWNYVADENIHELKILALYRFIVVFQKVPLNTPSDSFLSNFACNNLMYAIKRSTNNKDILIFASALHVVLNHLLPQKLHVVQKVMPFIISTLIIKKEEGHASDCMALLNYLLVDMNSYLKDSIDLVDGSQNIVDNSFNSTKGVLADNLKTFVNKLTHYSFDTLYNLKDFLKNNRQNIIELYKELKNIKGFSEDCSDSLIHRLMNALINIVKTSTDQKNVLEACNCLSEIGVCDLKTLVMMPPKDTTKVTDLTPTRYFSLILLGCLSDVLFDQNPAVVSCSVNSITSLLKCREGKFAMEFSEVDKDILQPFVHTKSTTGHANFSIDNDLFMRSMISYTWIPDEERTYLQWLSMLTIALLNILSSDHNYIPSLIKVCVTKPEFCEKLLPSLTGLIIYYANEDQIKIISTMINNVFKYFVDTLCCGHGEDSNSTMRKRSDSIPSHKYILMVQSMLDIIDFVRLQRSHYKKWNSSLVETYNYLQVDYGSVSQAASAASRGVTAVYYGELCCAAEPAKTAVVLNTLQKAFISIGDLDAIDGCGTDHLTNEEDRRKHLMRSGRSTDALLFHDIALTFDGPECDTGQLHYGIVKSLHQSGMYHIAMQYINSLPDNSELDDMKYDCCVQLGDWGIFVDTKHLELQTKETNANLDCLIKTFRYACLRDCLTIQNVQENGKLQLPLQRAKSAVALQCQKLNMNNCQNVYKVVSKLQLFKEIEDYYLVRSEKGSLTDLIDSWQVSGLPMYHDTKHLETLLSQRSLILEHASKYNKESLNDIVNLELQYAELLLNLGKPHYSQRFIAVAKKLLNSGEVSLAEGQVLWKQGHSDIALSLIRKLTNEESNTNTLTAAALRQYGNWMVESKYESGKDIIDKYLKRSLDVLGTNGHVDTRLKVYVDISKFADNEYKQVVTYMKSDIFINKVKCMENMKGAASSMRNSQLTMSRDEKKALFTNERLSNLDEAEIASTCAEKKRFLNLAMRYYLLSLAQGNENNLSIFRVISLWLENEALEFEGTEESSFEELLSAVPTRKYLPVLPQLAPRLTTDNNAFDQYLHNILRKCAKDHPHHTLPILFGLKNSHKDLCIMNASAGANKRARREDEPRVVAARNLVSCLAGSDGGLATIVNQMDVMCDAIISFAYFKPKDKQERQNVPKSEQIAKLKHLDAIPVPTINLPVRHDCTYTDFVHILSFGDTFNLVGGINCPKKMVCKGSDGKDRTILIKGEDDMRQDAVMQQVFTIVNTLLETNPVTSKYRLLIRTYKVVPMSRRSGVLQWVEGTTPIGHYLVGSSDEPNQRGAHARYRPMDISCNAARMKLQACHKQGKSNAEKLAVFQKILRDLKPVFHYFFTEHYLDPVTWYERRQAYVKSVATSSMVGYVLGLGDRHVQNILIDKHTAEVIHIDFGIAFDQGQALPTPETVPFRLTQDIVSGFGPCGVEGNFRRCCERTMQLLRDNQETLLTILEVLLCDPLYAWDMSRHTKRDNSATSAQDRSSRGGPAQRALLAVADKLSGAVRGPGQVAALLRRAADPARLSRLYPGWQPYL